MFKKSLIALSLITLPLTAAANWSAGGGYANISDDDLSLGVIYGAVSYEFIQENSQFSFVPELRLGTGVSDDDMTGIGSGVTIEVERFTAISVRGQYNAENGFYAFIMPSYANLDIKASSFYGSARDNSWEFGYGAGIGQSLNDKVSLEATYEDYDGTGVFTVGLKYAF